MMRSLTARRLAITVAASISTVVQPVAAQVLRDAESRAVISAEAVTTPTSTEPLPLTPKTSRFSKPSRQELDSLRLLFERYGKISKRTAEAAAGFLQVIDAIRAESNSEFHERIRRLPVTVRDIVGTDAMGREGNWREYKHRSGKVAWRFTPSNDTQEMSVELSGPSEPLSTVPSHREPHRTDCEYTDVDNVLWTGECATEQDIEDYTILALSLDSDVSTAGEEFEIDRENFCEKLDPDEMDEEEEDLCPYQLAQANGQHASSFHLFSASEGLEPSGDPADHFAPNCAMSDCAAKGLIFLGSVAIHADRSFKLWRVITAVNPPIGAIVGAAGVAVGTAALVAGTAMIFRDCVLN